MKEKYNVPVAEQGDFKACLTAALEEFGLPCTEKQADDLYLYYAQVIETNKYLNLTGITDMHEFVIKHIVDSLSCYDAEIFKPGSTVIDIGTGAGFPGIPLAIYDRSLEITLFDSLKKRLVFLESVMDKLELRHCKVLHGRAEELGHTAYRESYDIAVSRAVARLPVLLEWALPYVKANGYFVALKGAVYNDEIEESAKALQILKGEIREVRPIVLPTLSDTRAVLYIQKYGKTPAAYPRKPKDIKDAPL